jgi:hypothetical protein
VPSSPSKTGAAALPGWLRPVNRVMVTLLNAGLPMGPVRLVSVPGRKSGRMQTTPVTPFQVNGTTYIAALDDAQWVKNARAAGWAVLARGRRRGGVRLADVPLDERVAVLRQFPTLVPRGVAFFVRTGTVQPPADADAFAAAAPSIAVLRVDRIGSGR